MILLSFVLPVYNVENYIKKCIDSILTQGIDESTFEIICVDDGSKDGSADIIKEYQEKHQNIKLIQVENGGQGRARNIGINCAEGQYIFFVDSDDYIASFSIAGVLKKAIENDVDMICFDNKTVKDEKADECEYDEHDNSRLIETGKVFFVNHLCNNGPWWYLVKREFITDYSLSFVEGRYCEDGMFTIACFNKARQVMYCHTDVYRYVMRSNSTVHKKEKAHQFKVIEDFHYAINYINEYVLAETMGGYRDCLIERRNSYTFFLMIRMMKADFTRVRRNTILKQLQQCGCYPCEALSNDYGTLMVNLSRLFRHRRVYNICCSGYKFCDSIRSVYHKKTNESY